ncbi:MAG: hypothetical protein B5766_07245 [Candidatus Lumbricidophila eiseniae]|uniref:Phospholipase/carboxylesterase/thioesterase domain-containing protein n=1 Tax=Candidatus Lumbricidiphila eiseniae TaxID=1969409 RepID=A0A2A6FS34_9MICO|nr:MAG: hypothetical protein B5766_07245 [Candidatus Lumbricidophila eiseniae]
MNSVTLDPDAVLWSAAPADRTTRPVLLLLHGYNSSESDLFALSPFLPSEPVIASLRAPVSMGHGYAWYPLTPESDRFPHEGSAERQERQERQERDRFPHEGSATYQQQRAQDTRDHFPHKGSVEAVDAVLTWLNEHVEPATSVGLLGFSQGAAIAVELLRRAPDRYQFVVMLSGFVITAPQPNDPALADTKPPVLWGRGTEDRVIPPPLIAHSHDWLSAHTTLTERIYENLGHSVSPLELAEVTAFLRDHYAEEARL